MYANIDNFKPGAEKFTGETPELDRWITSELNQPIVDVDSNLEHYNPTDAARRMEQFVDLLSNWYVRRSRRRFWKSESDVDKLSAYNTLYNCLVTFTKLLAPFMPFVAEELYGNLVKSVSPDAPESVHLADFPVADTSKIDASLSDAIRLVMKISSLGRAARSEAGIKVRQPLSTLYVKAKSKAEKDAIARLGDQIEEEVNVQKIEAVDDPKAVLPNLPGGKLAEEGDVVIVVDTALTPELETIGMAREIVHRIQGMRRSANFEIADHIAVYYSGDEYVEKVLTSGETSAYTRHETLANELVKGIPDGDVYKESFKLNGHPLDLAVKKA
jgi:isoleucyl-tRNA synthetase